MIADRKERWLSKAHPRLCVLKRKKGQQPLRRVVQPIARVHSKSVKSHRPQAVHGFADAMRAARTVSLLVHAVSFHNGSRVEDFEPAFRVAAHLCLPDSLALSIAAGEETSGLAAQTLDLLTAILRSHCREASSILLLSPSSYQKASAGMGCAVSGGSTST